MAKEAAALLLASESHLSEEEPNVALQTATKALALFREAKDGKGATDAERAVIQAKLAASQIDGAWEQATEGVKSCRATKDKRGEGVMLLALAEACLAKEEPDEALKAAKDAQGILAGLKETALAAKASLVTADIYFNTEEPSKAIEAANEAVKLYKEAGNKEGEATAWQQVAVMRVANEPIGNVLDACDRALQIYKELGDKKGQAATKQGIADMYLAEKKPLDAGKASHEALKLYREVGHKAGGAAAVSTIVQSLIARGELSEALRIGKEEAMYAKTMNDKKGKAAALEAIFRVKLTEGDINAAVAAGSQALKAFNDAKDAKGAAKTLHALSSLRYDQGYWELAIKAAKEALKLLGGYGPAVAELETLIAYAHTARGEEVPSSASRTKALSLLTDLGKALEQENVEAFQGTLKSLNKLGAYTPADADKAFTPAWEKNSYNAEQFLNAHMRHFPLSRRIVEKPADQGGTFCSLRHFPVKPMMEGGIAGGVGGMGGVDWGQTMGQITLVYHLEGGPRENVPGGWAQEDIVVELSKKNVKVTIGDQPLKALTGELMEEIWRKDSWWSVDEAEGDLVLHLYKRDLRTWKEPWYSLVMTKSRRQAFPWTKVMEEMGSNHNSASHGRPPPADVPDETDSIVVQPGRPDPEEDEPLPGGGYNRTTPGGAFAPLSEKYICSAEDICIGHTIEQDDSHVTIQVHFERTAYENLKARHPLEALLSADIWDKELCVFFQGDKQNPILWAALGGQCVPEESTWKIVSSEGMRKRQWELGSYSPALQIKLAKAWDGAKKWENIFTRCFQHRLMIEDFEAEGGPKRYDGLKDAGTLRRSGYDLVSEDFWSHVDEYVRQSMKKTGSLGKPTALVMAA